MSPQTKLVLLVCLISCLYSLGSCLVCHQCQYDKCGDFYNGTRYKGNIGDCDDDQYCVKYKTIVWIQDSGDMTGSLRESHVVTRTCESKSGKKEGCTGWKNNGGVTLKCWCGTDACNSGNSISSATLIPLTVVSVVTAWFKMVWL